MVKMSVEYMGELRCKAVHEPSGSVVETDAPADNHGKAERFSPTDLVGAALATCIATILGIVAQRKGWDFKGMKLKVEKEMATTGARQITRLPVEIWMPISLPPADREQVEKLAHTCPVHKSLRADIDAPITIHWPN